MSISAPMSISASQKRFRFEYAWVLFLLALVPRLSIIFVPIPTQLDRTLPDDAYYYFLTARNIVNTGVPAVDGIHPSNGWHPLWMLINAGVYALRFDDPDVPVRILLALGAICDSLVAVVLFRVGRRYLGNGAALVGAGAYAINAMPLLQAVNGLETGLAALFIALSGAQTLALIEAPSPRRAALWGVLFGLCFLARTDTALVLVWFGIYALYRLNMRVRVRLIPLAALLALALVTPWLLWNQANFGSALTQSSSIAVPWAAETRFRMHNPDVSIWQLSWTLLADGKYWLRGDYLGAPLMIGLVLWPLGLWGIWRQRGNRLAMYTLLIILGGLSLIAVHVFVRHFPRIWYFAVMAEGLSFALMCFWSALSRPRVRLIALATLAVGMVTMGVVTWSIGYYPWQQRHQYAAALWVRDNTPPGTLIGSLNSGIIGYYGERPTVNLDGVVNTQAFAAIQESRLFDFIKSAGIRYFVDTDFALANEYGVFMGAGYPEGLQEVASMPEAYPELGYIRVYRVVENPD